MCYSPQGINTKGKILSWAKDQKFKNQNVPKVNDMCFVSET